MALPKPIPSAILAWLAGLVLTSRGFAAPVPPALGDDAPRFAPDRVVVQLTAEASRQAFAPAPLGGARRTRLGLPALDAFLAATPGTWLEPAFRGEAPLPPGAAGVDFSAFYVVHLARGAEPLATASRLSALSDVREAHAIGLAPAVSAPNDSLWSIAWQFDQPSGHHVHALEAWDQTLGDTSEVVALIDTGLIPYHPDIGGTTAGGSGQVWTNWAEAGGIPGVDDDHNGFVDDVHGWDFVRLFDNSDAVPGEDVVDEDNDPNDFVGHGTAVAGLIGALTNNTIGIAGTAPRVRILPLRVGWSSVRQPAGLIDMSYLAEAVRYATRMRVDVINISLANTAEPELEAAVSAALDSGVVVVVAAGNNGTPNDIAGRYPNTIAVAATDRNDVVPVWSSRGVFVDLAAPGDLVPTAIIKRPGTDSLGMRQPGYVPDESGTSFATPIVSGAVTLVQARRRALGLKPMTPALMGELLRATTDDISAENPLITGYGTGRLNMARAVSFGSRVRFSPPVLPFTGPGVRFRTNAGDTLLAFVNEAGRILFLDPGTLALRSDRSLNGIPTGGIAAADLGQERGLGLFVSLGSRLLGLGAAGEPLPGWPVDAPPAPDALVGTPLLADLDGDGSPEIVCASAHLRIWAWRADGSVLPGFPALLIPTPSVLSLGAANLDGQPGAEILVAGGNGILHVLRANGTDLPGWPVYVTDSGLSSPVVTRDAGGDTILVVAGNEAVYGFGPNGQEQFEADRADHQAASAPALGDLDGDGVDDVVIASPANVEAFDLHGRPLPGWPARWQATIAAPPIVGPFEAGDTLTVVAHDGTSLRAWSGSGRPLVDFPPLREGGSSGLTLLPPGGPPRLVAGTASEGVCYAYDGASVVSALPPLIWPTPGGNFARTGSRLDAPAEGVGDVLPPATVSDLDARPFGGAGALLLTWTAPPDVGPAGQAAEYDVRYARFQETLVGNPIGAPRITARVPHAAGQPESLVVAGLPSYANFFAVRSRDASGNWSAFSAPVARQGFDPAGDHGGLALELGRNPSPPPFPFFWRSTAAGASSALRIYDVGGRLVRTLRLGGATNGILYWDGADENGHVLGAGVYVASLGHDTARVRKRFVLLH